MTQELTPNTQITQENVGLLKAGDWLELGGRLHQFTETWRTTRGTSGIRHTGGADLARKFTYIGPDLGGGWIGCSGGENPVPGMRVEVRMPNGFETEVDSAHVPFWGLVIAFRPALSPPAEGWRGKSRGQIAYEGWSQGLPGCEWANQTATQKRAWERAAEALAAQPSAGAREEAVAWLETNKLNGEVRVSLSRRANTPTMKRRWDTQPLGLLSRSAPVPALLVQARAVIEELMYARTDKAEAMAQEWLATPAQPDTGDVAALREALDDLRERIAPYEGQEPKRAQIGIPLRHLRPILAALSKPNAPGAA